jgi:hypothetical protein
MFIYNVTSNVDQSIHKEWLKWMNEAHIPDMLATGKFTNAKMVRVLVEEDIEGFTYSVQYYTHSKEILNKYYQEDAPRLRQNALSLFADKVLSFRTELEIISEH